MTQESLSIPILGGDTLSKELNRFMVSFVSLSTKDKAQVLARMDELLREEPSA